MLRLSLALTTLGLVASTAHADVYKTLDAQGQPHYSDVWSPGSVLIKSANIQSSASPSSAVTPSKPAAAGDETADGGKAAKQVQSDLESVRAQQCKDLKEQYDKEIHARRIFQSSAPGDNSSAPRPYLSDAEADAERVKTRQAMDAACAGGGGN